MARLYEIPRKELLEGCRRQLNAEGRIRFWDLESHAHPDWFRKEWPNLLCDAEIFYRSRSLKPEPVLHLAFNGLTPAGDHHQVELTFEKVPLYCANYQLRAVRLDGREVDVVDE